MLAAECKRQDRTVAFSAPSVMALTFRVAGRHSTAEERLVLLGRSSTNRMLAVMFTDRGAERVRLISARPATRFRIRTRRGSGRA
ncbi:MAG: BrnT family toxin [Gemmatimonadaceae bacterium]